MIDINLLPDVLRKKERMPLKQALPVFGAVALFSLLAAVIANYQFSVIPELRGRRSNLEQERNMKRVQAEELKTLNAEIAKLTGYVDAVKTLYRQRVVWSKILSDLKNIVNFDPAMSEYNPDMRYIWFTKLTGRGKDINLTGFATSSNQVTAMQMPERLLQGFLSYAPVTLPEKDEEAKLQEQLRLAKAEHDALRRDNPSLPLQGPQELAIQQRLEEIKTIKSGGVALQPFNKLLVPGSLRLINATWSNAPSARRRGSSEELFPTQAWSFGISMQLK